MKTDPNILILHPYQLILAGAAAGTLTRFLLQPLDVLKVRFQLQTASKGENKKYPSLVQAIRIIVKEEGIQGLWKGHIPGQYLSTVYGAVQFFTFEYSTLYIKSVNPAIYIRHKHLINITCGSAAGLVATVISFPFDIIRTHLIFQGEPKMYNGLLDAFKKIYIKEGPKGFTKGLMSGCLSAAPLSGLVFYFHGLFSHVWLMFIQTNKSNEKKLSIPGNLIIGLLSGLCAKTVVYPLDLMKKRLQIQNFNGDSGCCSFTIRCSKLSECFILTVKKEGFFGLFKGFLPTILKASATTSLYFTFFDMGTLIISYLHNKN